MKKCQRDAHFKVARYPNVLQRIEKRGLEIEKSELVCYFLFQFVNRLLVMEMINHSKIWHCLEIFAFSYLVFKREVLLQTYCGVDNFSS